MAGNEKSGVLPEYVAAQMEKAKFYKKLGAKKVTFIPAACPKCNGQGFVTTPPNMPGDVLAYTSCSGAYPCDVCLGAKLVDKVIVEV